MEETKSHGFRGRGRCPLYSSSAAASSDVVALANEYAASVQKIIQEQKAEEEAEKTKTMEYFMALMREEQAVIDKDSERVRQASENCIAMLQKKQAEMTVQSNAQRGKQTEQLIDAAKHSFNTLLGGGG